MQGQKAGKLLQRDFGCTRTTAYPYFVLYNRYTGLATIWRYIYKTETPDGFFHACYHGTYYVCSISATTSLGDELASTPAAF